MSCRMAPGVAVQELPSRKRLRALVSIPMDKLLVLLRCVDAVVADFCFDHGDRVAVLQRAELFELFCQFQRGRRKCHVFDQELAAVGVEARVFQVLRIADCGLRMVAVMGDQ